METIGRRGGGAKYKPYTWNILWAGSQVWVAGSVQDLFQRLVTGVPFEEPLQTHLTGTSNTELPSAKSSIFQISIAPPLFSPQDNPCTHSRHSLLTKPLCIPMVTLILCWLIHEKFKQISATSGVSCHLEWISDTLGISNLFNKKVDRIFRSQYK